MSWKQAGAWVWQRLTDLGTLVWLFGVFGASTVASKAISVMPGGWHPPQYWALSAAWFSGTLFVIVGAGRFIGILWTRAHPPRLEVRAHGGSDASLSICPSVSGEFYGNGWLLDGSRQRPFILTWHLFPGTYRQVRAQDKSTVLLAGVQASGYNNSRNHLVVYGDGATVESWDLDAVGRAINGKDFFKDDLPWIRVRVELRAKQFSQLWAHEYRFRLNRQLNFEIHEVTADTQSDGATLEPQGSWSLSRATQH